MPVDFSLSAGLIVLCQAVESVLQFGVLCGVEIRQSLEECHQKPNMVGPNAGIPVIFIPFLTIQKSSARSQGRTASLSTGGGGRNPFPTMPGSLPGAPWHCTHISL